MNMRMSSRPSLDILIQKMFLYTFLMTTYPEIKMIMFKEYKRVRNQDLKMFQKDIGVENEYPQLLWMSKPRVETSRRKLLKSVEVS